MWSGVIKITLVIIDTSYLIHKLSIYGLGNETGHICSSSLSENKENTSYSVILNIGELVPPLESVPINFIYSRNQFLFRSISEFLTGIDPHPHPHASCCGQRLVHSMCMQFRESVGVAGIERNSWEIVRIHRDEILEIGWNWFRNVQHRGIG